MYELSLLKISPLHRYKRFQNEYKFVYLSATIDMKINNTKMGHFCSFFAPTWLLQKNIVVHLFFQEQ